MGRSKFNTLTLLSVLGALALAGCATVPIAMDGAKLEEGQGLVAFRTTSNVTAFLRYIDYSNTSTVGSRFAEDVFGSKGLVKLEPGDRYYLVPMEAGEYMWSQLQEGDKFAPLQTTNRFRVRPNAITYIGSIELRSLGTVFTLHAVDREAEMRAYLDRSYPIYMRTYRIHKDIVEMRLH